MGAHMDSVQCAIIDAACMMHAVFDGALDGVILVFIHHHFFTTFICDGVSMASRKEIMMEKNDF